MLIGGPAFLFYDLPMLNSTLDSRSKSTVPAINHSAQDRLWVSQTLAGDSQAYALLMDKYKDQLFELTCRVLKDRCQGEDILQDAFLQAYQHLGSFRHDSKFSTWIYAIVLNGLRNRLRRNKIIGWSSLDARRMGRDDIEGPEIPHREPSIDVVVERKMDLEAIQRIIASFPLHYQTIFIMHYFQNLPLQEIADRIGRPLGTVKVYLHRSRKRLYNDFKRHATPPIPPVLSVACLALA